jgi:hypothetical protein
MNHSSTVNSISSHLTEIAALANYSIPYILGETNSLYNEGAPGLSNSFGAALWGVDFNLWCASQGIRRVHMHQGTNYRYQSWQPISTSLTTLGTKAPYYGNIAVAAILGNLVKSAVTIANLPLQNTYEAAYAAYVNSTLARVAVINMRQYNYTVNGTSSLLNPVPRSSLSYDFAVPDGCGDRVRVQRLWANGSDAISGITWDGHSYNYELDQGKPVRLTNVTTGEILSVQGGSVSVTVPDSSVAVLNFYLDG